MSQWENGYIDGGALIQWNTAGSRKEHAADTSKTTAPGGTDARCPRQPACLDVGQDLESWHSPHPGPNPGS